MKILLQFLFLFISLNLFGQAKQVKIYGSVTDTHGKMLSNISVVLVENSDTVARSKSGNEGDFFFETELFIDRNYIVLLKTSNQKFGQNKGAILHSMGDTVIPNEYHVDLLIPGIIHDRFDTGIYYEINETKEYQNFDLNEFKGILSENPQMCIRFMQTVNPKEKKNIAKQRKAQFLRDLETAGIHMNQIVFSDEVFQLDFSKTQDRRSRIEGVILSMDGNCN